MIASKTYCITADRKAVVDETDPKAAFLLVARGSELDGATAKKYGIEAESEAPKTAEKRVIAHEKIVKR